MKKCFNALRAFLSVITYDDDPIFGAVVFQCTSCFPICDHKCSIFGLQQQNIVSMHFVLSYL